MEKAEFKLLVEEKRSWYKGIGKVFCPALNEEAVFNAKGFYHLQRNGSGELRTRKQQILRMNLLRHVPETIRDSGIVDYQIRKGIHYWELGKVIGDNQITVILRRVGQGEVHFYSVWKKRRITKKPSEGQLL